jgi:uncharacterized protein (DUF3084 family)
MATDNILWAAVLQRLRGWLFNEYYDVLNPTVSIPVETSVFYTKNPLEPSEWWLDQFAWTLYWPRRALASTTYKDDILLLNIHLARAVEDTLPVPSTSTQDAIIPPLYPQPAGPSPPPMCAAARAENGATYRFIDTGDELNFTTTLEVQDLGDPIVQQEITLFTQSKNPGYEREFESLTNAEICNLQVSGQEQGSCVCLSTLPTLLAPFFLVLLLAFLLRLCCVGCTLAGRGRKNQTSKAPVQNLDDEVLTRKAQDLEVEVNELRESQKATQSRVKDLEESNAEKEEDLRQKDCDIATKAAQLEQKDEELVTKAAQIEQNENWRALMDMQIQQKDADMATKLEELVQKDAEIEELACKSIEQHDLEEELKEKFDEQAKRLAEVQGTEPLRARHQALKQQLKAVQTELEEAHRDRHQGTKEVERLQTRLVKAKEAAVEAKEGGMRAAAFAALMFQNWQKNRRDLRMQTVNIDLERAGFQTVVAEHQGEMANLGKVHAVKAAALEKTIADQKIYIVGKDKVIAEQKALVKAGQKATAEYKARMGAKQMVMDQQNESIGLKDKTISEQKAAIEAQQRAIDEQKVEIDRLETQKPAEQPRPAYREASTQTPSEFSLDAAGVPATPAGQPQQALEQTPGFTQACDIFSLVGEGYSSVRRNVVALVTPVRPASQTPAAKVTLPPAPSTPTEEKVARGSDGTEALLKNPCASPAVTESLPATPTPVTGSTSPMTTSRDRTLEQQSVARWNAGPGSCRRQTCFSSSCRRRTRCSYAS